jgi:hypothetical protein
MTGREVRALKINIFVFGIAGAGCLLASIACVLVLLGRVLA